MICSSVNLVRFICPSFHGASTRETVHLATSSAEAIHACVSRLWRSSMMTSVLAAELALGDRACRLEASVSPSLSVARLRPH